MAQNTRQNLLSSAVYSKTHLVNFLTAKSSLLSVFYQTCGKVFTESSEMTLEKQIGHREDGDGGFAECLDGMALGKVHFQTANHTSLPSVCAKTLCKDLSLGKAHFQKAQ